MKIISNRFFRLLRAQATSIIDGQCFKCNFEKTCDGMSYAERNFTDCDVIEIETYEGLVTAKKNDLQTKFDAAMKEACEQIKNVQFH